MYTVIEKFADKYTGRVYEPGEKVNFNKDRAEEILAVGKLIEKIPTAKRKPKAE